jgi:hypothetical protein
LPKAETFPLLTEGKSYKLKCNSSDLIYILDNQLAFQAIYFTQTENNIFYVRRHLDLFLKNSEPNFISDVWMHRTAVVCMAAFFVIYVTGLLNIRTVLGFKFYGEH